MQHPGGAEGCREGAPSWTPAYRTQRYERPNPHKHRLCPLDGGGIRFGDRKSLVGVRLSFPNGPRGEH